MERPTGPAAMQIDHVRIRELMGKFAKAQGLADTKEVLAVLVKELAEHFQSEEGPGGLFDDMRKVAPEKDSLIAAFEAEHVQMLRGLESLVERISEVERVLDELQDAKKGFLRELGAHEQAENRLMLDCYYEDLGIGE